MAMLSQKPVVTCTVTLELSEQEARALDAIAGYSTDDFLRVFYENLGKAYLEPHEAGLRSLFAGVRENVPGILGRTDDARKVFNKGRR